MLKVDLGCNRKLELGLLSMTRRVDYAGERSEVVKYFFGDFVYKGMGEVPNKFITPYLPSNLSLQERRKGGGYPSYG